MAWEAMHIDQVLGLLRAIGLDAELMDHFQNRIQAKAKAPQKPHSEIVAELEAKERRAANHSVHLQKVVDTKRQQLTQAETRLQAHLEEHEQIKEQLERAYEKQVRHISRNPYDPDSASEVSACEIQESDDEEEEEDEVQEMEEITTDEMFADVPHEDYVEKSSSLPPEGKGGPPPPPVVGGVQVRDKAEKAKVKKVSLKKKSSSSKTLCG